MSKEITISVNTGSSVDTTKDLRKEISQLKKELFSLEEGTEQYNQTFQELSNKMLEFKDRNEALKMSAQDLGQQIGNVINVTKGLASGFEVVQGTMALFGTESEAVEQIMVKLQAAISIVQGLEGLEGLTKSIPGLVNSFGNITGAVKGLITKLGVLKAAILGTGIGAIAVALGAIIANWDKIEGLWSQTKVIDELKDDLDGLNDTFKENENQLKINQEAAYSQYRQAVIASKGAVDEMAEAEKHLQETLKGNSLDMLQNNLNSAKIAEVKAWANYADAVSNGAKIKVQNELKAIAEDFTKKREEAEAKLNKFNEENAVKEIKATKESEEKQLEIIKDANQKKIDAHTEYINNIDSKLKSLGLRGIGNDVFITPKEKWDEAHRILKEALDNNLITYEQYLIAKDNLDAKYGNEGLGFEKVATEEGVAEYNNWQDKFLQEQRERIATNFDEEVKITAKGIGKVQTVQEKGNKNSVKNEENTWNQRTQIVSAGLGLVTSLMDKENEAYKPIAATKALMDTYLAANSVFLNTPGGLVPRIIATSAAVAAGLANVHSILKADPSNASASASNNIVSTPNVTSATQLPVDVLGTTLSSNNEVEIQAEAAKNTRVYVLESDIANATNSVKTKVEESRF